jgi:flavorubredoxin
MPVTHAASGTSIEEVAEQLYRINIPMPAMPGGFSFNQYLLVDDEPLLFHTGLRRQFPLVREAIAAVLPVEKLRWISFSHFEADECGGLNELLAVAPQAQALCGRIAANVSIDDFAVRPAKALAHGETLRIGKRTVEWIDTPHLPHGWETGMLWEPAGRTLFCSDLFTQPGATTPALTEADVLGPSEAMRHRNGPSSDYYAHSKRTPALLDALAARRPRTLACMHGSAWVGNGERLLLELKAALNE